MLNIIKSDLYKMFKSRNFYLINLVFILITLAVGIIVKVDVSRDYEAAQAYNTAMEEENSLTEDEYYTMQEEAIIEQDVKEFMSIHYSSITMLTLAVFLAIFVCSELDTGYIKNIIPLKTSRTNLLVAKNVVSFVFILVQMVLGFGTAMFSTFLLSGKINISNPRELVIYLGFQILLAMSFAASIILLSYLTKSKAAVMTIGVLLAVNVQSLFLGLLDAFVNTSQVSLAQFSVITNSRLPVFDPNDYQRVLLISIGYFIVYNVLSMIRLKRLEIT